MNSNGNHKHSNGFVDPPYQNPFPINTNVNGMQWPPQIPSFPPFPPQIPSNAWPQQQQHIPNAPVSNGMAVGIPLHIQQASQFSMVPANILQDVFRLSVPVGNNPNDDALLIKVLKESAGKGQTYKQAIETLHGINSHAANLWKDYYLDHKTRLDKLVSPQPDVPVKTVKKPSPYIMQPPHAQSKSTDSNRVASSSRTPQTRRVTIKKERESPKPFATTSTAKPSAKTKRRTINSITAHEPVLNLKLLPPQADIILPDPPSRPPTPPTKIVRGTNGNRYTPEDKEFFIKFIHWELEQDPDLTKDQLCTKLAEKVPSHSAMSWKSHWSGSHELADKIFAQYDRPFSDNDKASDNSPPLRKPRPNYVESGSDSESNIGSSSVSELETGSDLDDLDELLKADSDDVGPAGGSYTDTDMRNFVLYLAGLPEESSVSWSDYYEMHPQRTEKSWREYYRRHEKEINRLVVQYRKRERERTRKSTLLPQRGRPSWAPSGQTGRLPSALKRKVSSGGYDGKFKRPKGGSD